MKKRKTRKLEPCVFEIFESDEAMLFNSLLNRAIGASDFCVKRSKKPNKYTFTFWVTEAEKESLEEAWDKVVQLKWEGVEDTIFG